MRLAKPLGWRSSTPSPGRAMIAIMVAIVVVTHRSVPVATLALPCAVRV